MTGHIPLLPEKNLWLFKVDFQLEENFHYQVINVSEKEL